MITILLLIIGLALLPAAIEVALALLIIIVPVGILLAVCAGVFALLCRS